MSRRPIGVLVVIVIAVTGCAPTVTPPPTPSVPPNVSASDTPSASPTAPATPSPGITPAPGASISAYEPLTEVVGWVGLRDDTGASLAKTTDGGQTWQRIGPARIPGIRSLEELRFSDERRGFAIALAARGTFPPSVVLTTDDGGQSWAERLSIEPPDGRAGVVGDLVAVDDRHAWVVTTPGPCDPAGCVTELRATADAGGTWSTAYRPNGAVLVTATFADVSRGWLTESFVVRRGADLLLTPDGGRSWQTSIDADRLAPPEDFLAISGPTPRDVWALSFDAVSCIGRACGRYALRSSHDGGLTWSTLHTLDEDAGWWANTDCGGLPGGATFLDATHGLIPLGQGPGGSPGGPGSVLFTEDGGQTFKCVRVTADKTSITVRFANARIGWALATAVDLKRSLYRTIDGGLSWQVLSPPGR
ncbi:MAG: hypothetical protein E6J13_07460 [Chloroflexi bacterium]|nr:MAG: hypothetical protein E6J13_07460 [Chloroflexota bacterium]